MRKFTLLLACNLFVNFFLFSADPPLPSWNEGKAKQAIIRFINQASNASNPEYIPTEERIATFDQDGTLWVEHPIYAQAFFAIQMIKELSAEHPEWKDQEPYKTILEGNMEKLKAFHLNDLEKILAATHSGVSVSDFKKRVNKWLEAARHPRFDRPFTELTYQPMLELIDYLKQNQFKVYIVSGGGQDFIRAYSERVYGIPPENVIGSAEKTKYEYTGGNPNLIKLPEVLLIDDKTGKPEAINLFIGRRPAAAFGNSDGDRQMLEWSQVPQRASLQLLVHHDDSIREYAYDESTKIGTFPPSLKDEAQKRNWVIVSMKNDWRQIFPTPSKPPP